MAENQKEILKTITSLCVSAVVDHGIEHRNIIYAIRKALSKASKDSPKVPILYNTCFGGFGVSKHFLTFAFPSKSINEEDLYYDDLDRVEAAKKMPAYADEIAQTYPILMQFVTVYTHSNVHSVLRHAFDIIRKEDMITKISNNYESLVHYLKYSPLEEVSLETTQSNVTKKPTKETFLTLSYKGWSQYSIETLCEFHASDAYAEILADVQKELSDLLAAPVWSWLPVELISHIIAYVRKPKLEKSAIKTKDFMDVVESSQEPDLRDVLPTVWQHQTFFPVDTMCYLAELYTLYPHLFEYYAAQVVDIINDDGKFTLGLIAASSKHAKLNVTHVPAYTNWKINDYDGWENVEMM